LSRELACRGLWTALPSLRDGNRGQDD